MIELLLDAEDALALGLLDRAERTYRSVLDADPRNGIAAVGLARVALERGDEARALDLARAGLEIDPDNATARRMIERLEEVARHRVAAARPKSETDGQPPGGAATGNATPDEARAAPNAPARPGLLRRILRRP